MKTQGIFAEVSGILRLVQSICDVSITMEAISGAVNQTVTTDDVTIK
jgi:hypothetical protein